LILYSVFMSDKKSHDWAMVFHFTHATVHCSDSLDVATSAYRSMEEVLPGMDSLDSVRSISGRRIFLPGSTMTVPHSVSLLNVL
jgi:hypothetical protein